MTDYCSEHQYKKIELNSSADLKFSQVVKATITSINTAANTANVVLVDTCDKLDGVDFTAVPFFYHCDFSAGTEEDLAFGHLAFAPDEIVYVLYIPSNGSTPERAYIVGHVDLRETKVCFNGVIAVGDTTVGYTKPVWEKKLLECAAIETPYFTNRPYLLSQVKYANETVDGTETILLFHYNYSIPATSETPAVHYRAITVYRGGASYTRSEESVNSLMMYASLSEDFNYLYIVTSIVPDGATEREIGYQRLTWKALEGIWGDIYFGSVDCSAYDGTQNYVTVDRQGRVHAAITFVDQPYYNYDFNFDVCEDVWPSGPVYYYYSSGTTQTGHFYCWDIDTLSFVELDNSKSHGMTIANGDYQVIKSEWNIDNGNRWDMNGNIHYASGYQSMSYSKYHQEFSGYSNGVAKIGAVPIANVDSGSHFEYMGSVSSETNWDETCGGNYRTNLSISHSGYEDQNGSRTIQTIGGWAIYHGVFSELVPDGNNYNTNECGQNAIPCNPMSYNELSAWSIISQSINRHQALWPVQFEFNDISNAFYSYDQITNTWYAGAFVNYSEGGDFQWRIFRNGTDITSEVAACVGNLVETNFSAIYFR